MSVTFINPLVWQLTSKAAGVWAKSFLNVLQNMSAIPLVLHVFPVLCWLWISWCRCRQRHSTLLMYCISWVTNTTGGFQFRCNSSPDACWIYFVPTNIYKNYFSPIFIQTRRDNSSKQMKRETDPLDKKGFIVCCSKYRRSTRRSARFPDARWKLIIYNIKAIFSWTSLS